MRKEGVWLITAAVLACTACLGDQGKLEVRSVAGGLKAGSEPVPFRIAEARSHLALGNVALALEGFRKAAREDPASMQALAGIADCYDRMGRFDLSRRYYEMALAVEPRNHNLLTAFAGSLSRQGLAAEAAAVHAEIADLTARLPSEAESADAEALVSTSAPGVESAMASRDTLNPPALTAPAPVGQSVTIALPPPRPAEVPRAQEPAPQVMAVRPVGKSVTIALPPPRQAPAAAPNAGARGPRLQRLSLSEVALITGAGPRWKRVEPQAARLAGVSVGELRVLNAARVSRLAAQTRTYLHRFGWRKVTIGDAAAARAHSLIVYPQGQRAEAGKLSARLGFAMAQRPGVRQVTVLLGRDAATHPGLRTKG